MFCFNLTGLVRTLSQDVDMVTILLFLLELGGPCVWITAGLGAQANTHTTSELVLLELRQKCKGVKGAKFLVRFYSSCRVIKVGMGSINYIDKATPLTVLDYCIASTVNFLLLT